MFSYSFSFFIYNKRAWSSIERISINNKKTLSRKMKKDNKQKKPHVIIIIGAVIIILVGMVVYSNDAVKVKLNFFGTGLVIEKKQE